MNYTFFFFLCASAVLILSTITICVAPIINGFLSQDWGNPNCQKFSDEYDYWKGEIKEPTEEDQKRLDELKKSIGICKRQKAMNALEYSSLICDIILGGICAILGLLHSLEIGKTIEKKTGLIGIIAGTIGFIITILYVIFSGYIFTNDRTEQEKLFENHAYLKWNGYNYVPPYDLDKADKNPDIIYATYSELGQKQYNYDSDLLKTYPEYINCQDDGYNPSDKNIKTYENNGNNECTYIWKENLDNESISLKYRHDRWITTIILCVFIFILNIGLILFGFFLFKNSGESNPGSIPIPSSSVNALDNNK